MRMQIGNLTAHVLPVPEEIAAEADALTPYEQQVAHVLLLGNWLLGSDARQLPPAEWEARYREYQEGLAAVRRLGDALRAEARR